MKYADNVLKGFATSISVVLSCYVASLLFDGESQFNSLFLAGAMVVCTSAFMFSLFPYGKVSIKIASNYSVSSGGSVAITSKT